MARNPRRALCLLLLCASACARRTPAPAGPPADPALRAEIERVYAAFSQAIIERKVELVMSRLTADVEWRWEGGKVEHLAEIRSSMGGWITSRPERPLSFDVVSVWVAGNDVVAEVVLHDGPDRHGWTDTWRRSPGGWQNSLGIQHAPAR